MDINKVKTALQEIWSIKYMPTKLEDLACSDDVRAMLKSCIDNNSIPNHLCFYGTPGTGKNSIVNILKNNLDLHMLIINASEENGIDDIRGKVMSFTKSGALFDKPKVIVMNEADGLSQSAQNSMRELMESRTDSCRFIFTCNYITQIITPLISRFSVYKIDPPLKEIIKKLLIILKKENVTVTKEFIFKIIKTKGRDLRKLLNDIQVLSNTHSELTEDIIETDSNDYISFFDEIFKLKDLKSIGDKVKSQLFDEDIYSILVDYCIEKNYSLETIPIIADHLFKSTTIFDKDIIFMSCLLSIKKYIM